MVFAATITAGLACFNALEEFGTHEIHVISKEGHEVSNTIFYWVNTILSNVKTSLAGTFHCINFKKYGYRYLADIQYRFNRRFDLKQLFFRVLKGAVDSGPINRDFLEAVDAG